MWQNYLTGGSRGIRESHEYVREGGAAARDDARRRRPPTNGRCRSGECTRRQGRHHPHGVRPHARPTARWRKLRPSSTPPKELTLKDPKDWTIAGKPLKRLDTADKVNGKTVYGIDLKLPGMLNAAVKDCPVFGGKLKSFDAAKVAGMPGVKKVVQVGDNGVAVVADTWWHAKTALDALPIEWDDGPNAKVSSASIAAWLKEGLDAEQAFVGNKQGDVEGGDRRRREEVEAVYSYRSRTTPHGADERHGALYPGQVRGLDRTQNAEAAFGGGVQASGLPTAQVRGAQHAARRRLRPARRARLRARTRC